MSSEKNQGIRVLLVDGEPSDARRTEVALAAGLGPDTQVVIVHSLAESLTKLSQGEFDIVVLELDLPDITGVAAYTRLRMQSPSTPVVVYTRSAVDGMEIVLLREGAQECLCKDSAPPDRLARELPLAIERQRRLTILETARTEAAHKATHDPLTGLANRELFLDQFERALALSRRHGRKTAILFVDLDDFKAINDTYGHTRGDVILQTIATRLLEAIRHSDSVARLAGDEFVVLLREVTSRRDILHVRSAILAAIRKPIDIGGGQRLTVEGSAGCAMAPLDGITAKDLLDAADIDMYRDKFNRQRERMATPANGVPSLRSVIPHLQATESLDSHVPHRREARMRQGLIGGEFEVWLQPVADACGDGLVGAAAQLFWRHPDFGCLAPASFQALAEDTGMIVSMGERVLRTACEVLAEWVRSPHFAALRLSVSVSAVQLREHSFPGRVAAILQETGAPPDRLVFELAERSCMLDGELAVDALTKLSALGTHLYLEGFGEGADSLHVVKHSPISGIKIQAPFVTNMLTDASDLAIVASLIQLGRGLGLDVIADGVTTPQHAERLVELRCVHHQGACYGDAVPVAEFLESLPKWAGGRGLPPVVLDDAARGMIGDVVKHAWRARSQSV